MFLIAIVNSNVFDSYCEKAILPDSYCEQSFVLAKN